MFYNENPQSKKKGKKDKKKQKRVAKQDVTNVEDGPHDIKMDLGTLAHFSTLSIAAPITTDDVDTAITALQAKAAYFLEHGKGGKTLREIKKMESDARKGGKKGKKESAEPAPAEEEVVPVAEPEKEKKSSGKPQTNQAFVFIKPHAVTDAVKELVSSGLVAKGIKIVSEGSISSEDIDEKKLIDQHYYAIASKATILKPYQLNVPEDKFEEKFEEEWNLALDMKKVYNAMDGCHKLGIDADEMDRQWGICKKAGKLIKFGGGFYCGLIEIEGKDPVYVFNGFFMSMRSKFTAPGLSIYYYVVEFDANELSWEDFRGKVLGPTDPAEAPGDSLRGLVMAEWKKLGLDAEPNVGDNGVHASASPFEGLAERLNWVGANLEDDSFGKAMLEAGISENWLTAGCVDPQVVLDGEGKKGSLFDAVEDMDCDECLAKLKDLFALAPAEAEAPKSKPAPAPEPEPEPEMDLEAVRAAARKKASEFAASLTPEEQAIYGAKPQVAASGVRPDSDSDSEGEADFAVGGDDDGVLLGDY
jgi:nucleoside diphosphate kinase